MSRAAREPHPLADDDRRVLEVRAQRLRTTPPKGEAEAAFWVAEFQVGDERYAMDLGSLRACVALKAVSPVPLAPPDVVGILRYEGRIITAFSLAALLGVTGWRQDPAVLLIVDLGWGRAVALDCEETPRPTPLPVAVADQVKAAAEKGPVIELALPGGRPLSFIDLRRLLDRRAGERRHA